MFFNPLFLDFINCNESMVANETERHATSCLQLNFQYYIFLVLCTAAFVLFLVMRILKKKTQVDRDILTSMDILITVNFVLVVSVFLESLVILFFNKCRTFPHIHHGMLVTITISILRFIYLPSLFLKNWLVAIISFLRLKLFIDSSSFSRFSFRTNLVVGCIGFIGVALTVPRMMMAKGQVCKHDPLGPVKVVPWHRGGADMTWLDVFETFVWFPAQGILPVVLCFCCTVITVYYIPSRPQDDQRAVTNRAFVLLWLMLIVFFVTQTPVAVFQVLYFANFGVVFWIANVLVLSDSIWNCVIYIHLINEREFCWTSNSSNNRQVFATTMVTLNAGEQLKSENDEEGECRENLL